MNSKTETLYRITYVGGSREVYGSILDKSLDLHRQAGVEILSVEQIPFCGWKNPWTDSGDRGMAQADHDRVCTVCGN